MSENSLDRIHRVGVAASIVILVSSVWVNTYLPFQDYPEWLFQARVAHQLMSGATLPDVGYSLAWFPVQPNVAVSVVLVALQEIVSVETAGKILLTVIVLAFVFGWRNLMVSSDALHPLRWMGILFAFHYFFYLGFLSYCLGIALVMPALAWLVSKGNTYRRRSVILMGVLGVILYLVHGVAFGILLVGVAAFLLTNRSLTRTQKCFVAAALAPSLILLLLYVMFSEKAASIALYDSVAHQLLSWRYAFSFFNRLVPLGSELPISILNAALLGAVAWLFVRTWQHSNQNAAYRVLALCLAGLVLLIPFQRAGQFFPLNARFVVPAAAFFAASSVPIVKTRLSESVVIALGVVAAMVHSAQLHSFNAEASSIAKHAAPFLSNGGNILVAARGYVEEFDKQPMQRVSGGIRTLVHFRRYVEIHALPSYVRTFESGLLKRTTTTPHPEVFSLDSSLESSQHLDEAIAVLRAGRRILQQHVDCVVVMGKEFVLERFRDALNPLFEERANDRHLLVMVKRNTSKIPNQTSETVY